MYNNTPHGARKKRTARVINCKRASARLYSALLFFSFSGTACQSQGTIQGVFFSLFLFLLCIFQSREKLRVCLLGVSFCFLDFFCLFVCLLVGQKWALRTFCCFARYSATTHDDPGEAE
jgi:hypothetical protein